MRDWFLRHVGRRQNITKNDSKDDGTASDQPVLRPAEAPVPLERPSSAQPVDAAAPSGMQPNDTTTVKPAMSLDQIRAKAREILSNDEITAKLTPTGQQALHGLLAEQPTHEQITYGIEALNAVYAALETARFEARTQDLPDVLRTWYWTPTWPSSRRWLDKHLHELPHDAASLFNAASVRAIHRGDEEGARTLTQHASLLREARRTDVNSAYQTVIGEDAFAEIDDLIVELAHHKGSDNLAQQEALCRRILDLDSTSHRLEQNLRADVYRRLGRIRRLQGMRLNGPEGLHAIVESEQAYRAALATSPSSTSEHTDALFGLGHSLWLHGERLSGPEGLHALVESEQAYGAILAIVDPNADPSNYAEAQVGLGNALSLHGERLNGPDRERVLREAEQAYRAALAVIHPNADPSNYAAAQLGLGNVLVFHGERLNGPDKTRVFRAAEQAYRAALAVIHPASNISLYVNTQAGLGNVLVFHGERLNGPDRERVLRAAEQAYRAALAVIHPNADPQIYVRLLSGLGASLSRRGERLNGPDGLHALVEAEQVYRAALAVIHPIANSRDWANIQSNLGDSLRTQASLQTGSERQRLLQEAIMAFQQALSKYPAEVSPDVHRSVAISLANTYLLQAAIATDAAVEVGIWERAWQVVAPAMTATNQLELQAMSPTFRQQEWARSAVLYNLGACIQAQLGNVSKAVALIERGRARWLAEAAGRRSADLGLLNDGERDHYLRAVEQVQAIEALGRHGSDPLALVEEARSANERLQSLVARLRMSYPGFLPENDVSIPALAGALHLGEALVYLIPQQTGTLLLAIPFGEEAPSQVMWLNSLTSDDIFELAVQPDAATGSQRGFLVAAVGGLPDEPHALVRTLDELLPALGDKLMRKVVEMVRGCGCHRAVLVPSGLLSMLPLHAASYLPLNGEPATGPKGRRYACDDLAISYAPSGLVYLDAHQTADRQAQSGLAKQIFIAGNPQLTRKGAPWTRTNRGYLRYGEWEARRVAAIAQEHAPPLAVDLALNDAATWACVVDGLKAADVAHLALHAAFNVQDPMQSAFLVAFQARLLLRDLLDPRQAQLQRLRLVVLSACQSAVRDFNRQTEEAVGLFGALLAGGVPCVIGTLWSVNDLATAALMESFARRYLVEGAAPDAALRAAARELRGVVDSASNPAGKGRPVISASTQHMADEIKTDQGEAQQLQPQLTPAIRRWEELAQHDPEAVDATRFLSVDELEVAGQQVHDFAGGKTFLSIPRDHPIYWAAFVLYGTS